MGELNVSPGTPLQMEIFLDNNSAPIYGLLVTHMQVTDTKTQEETIIYNGWVKCCTNKEKHDKIVCTHNGLLLGNNIELISRLTKILF